MLIKTTYAGPTDHSGPRITASADGRRKTIPYPYQLSGSDCHAVAAKALARKLGHPETVEPRLVDSHRHGYYFEV